MPWNLFKPARRRNAPRNRREGSTICPTVEPLEDRLAPSSNVLTWLNDRSLLKEPSSPDVYVIYGGAKFYIPSQEEFSALGFSWSDIRTVPNGFLANVSNVPRQGTVLRERSDSAVYTMSGPNRFLIPTPYSFEAMRYDLPGVLGIVPNGGLASFPTVHEDSLAMTPPSLVFPPQAEKFYPLYTTNATRVTSLFRKDGRDDDYPTDISLVELRGWLRGSGDSCANDGTWEADFEVDSEWTDTQGIDLNQVLKVGNLVDGLGNLDTPADSPQKSVGTPQIKVELKGWRQHDPDHADLRTPPERWTHLDAAFTAQCPDTYWPFHPLHPMGQPLENHYVRMVGSLVTDVPHYGDHPTLRLWGVCGLLSCRWREEDRDNPARWTELHPPDKIEILDAQGPHYPRYTLKEAAVIAPPGPFLDPHMETLDVDLRPSTFGCPGQHIAVQELVGSETNFRTIVEGNPRLDGAQITVYQDHVHVHVAVRSNGDVPGKFKALYRLSWDPARAEPIMVSPDALPGGTAGRAYSQLLSACGGATADGPFRFEVTAGALPPGLTLYTGGQLSGTTTVAGSFPFTVMATGPVGFTGHRDYRVAIDPGPATQLRVASPADVPAGVPFSATVTAVDTYGNTNSGYRGIVHFACMDGAATLPADYTFTGPDNGRHLFSNGLTLRTPGTWVVSVTDTAAPPLTGAVAITIPPEVAAMLSLGAPPFFSAGAPGAIIVTAWDRSGRVAPTYRGTVHFSCTDAAATFPSDYTFTPLDAGTHTFSDGATLRTAGTKSITATDTWDQRLTATSGVVVYPGQPATFRFDDLSPTLTAGEASDLTLVALDGYGNVAPGFRGTVHFTSSDPAARLPADYTFQDYDPGAHTWNHRLTVFTAGHPTLTATDVGPGGIHGSVTLTVAPARPVTLALADLPPQVAAGAPTGLTVNPRDAFGNAVTTYRGTVHFTSTDGAALLPDDYTFTEADNGAHTFTALAFRTAASQTLTVTGLRTGEPTVSATVQVDPALAIALTIDAPVGVVLGTPFDVTVSARDWYGNLVTGYTGTVRFSSPDDGALLPDDYTFTADDGGAHTFPGVTLFMPGDQALWVTDPDGAPSGTATVTGAALARSLPGGGLGMPSVQSAEGALLSFERDWPDSGSGRTGGAALLPPASEAATTWAVLQPLDVAALDRFFAADHGKGPRPVRPRPRSDASDDVWRDPAFFRPVFSPFALE
jgi:hypothetical protein